MKNILLVCMLLNLIFLSCKDFKPKEITKANNKLNNNSALQPEKETELIRAESDLGIFDLVGKVKSVDFYSFRINYKFGQPYDTTELGNYMVLTDKVGAAIVSLKIDTNGNLIEKTERLSSLIIPNIASNNQEPTIEIYFRIFEYSYQDNLLVKETVKSKDSGKLISKTFFSYNEKNQLVEENKYFSDGSLEWKKSYVYNEQNLLIREDKHDHQGKLVYQAFFKYDNKGNLYESTSYDANWVNIGSLDHTIAKPTEWGYKDYLYNDEGVLIKKTLGRDSTSPNYIYEFDIYGNWIKKVTFRENKPIFINIRNIVYFRE